jgi:hypothetical protein
MDFINKIFMSKKLVSDIIVPHNILIGRRISIFMPINDVQSCNIKKEELYNIKNFKSF